MKQPVARITARASAAAIILALAAACGESFPRQASLSVASIFYDNASGLPSTLYFALSDRPQPEGGYKAYTASVPVSDGNTAAGPTFDVSWEAKDEWRKGREFWLLVAEDTNSTGVIDSGDAILPSMRVVLEDGKSTTLDGLRFIATGTPLGVLTYDPGAPKFVVRLFMSDPDAIDNVHRVILRLGAGGNLSDGNVAINFEMPITDPDIATAFYVQGTGVANGISIFDIDGDGTTTIGVDWASATNYSAVPALNPDNGWMLWPGQLAQP